MPLVETLPGTVQMQPCKKSALFGNRSAADSKPWPWPEPGRQPRGHQPAQCPCRGWGASSRHQHLVPPCSGGQRQNSPACPGRCFPGKELEIFLFFFLTSCRLNRSLLQELRYLPVPPLRDIPGEGFGCLQVMPSLSGCRCHPSDGCVCLSVCF